MQLAWRDMPIGASIINTSLTVAERIRLQSLAKGRDVLEVGSAYGFSTVALGLVARSVTAVDPHTGHGSYGELLLNLRANNLLDRTTVLVELSQTALPRLAAEGLLFDLVWIDGDHGPDAVEHDVTWGRKLLKPGGVIACHDYDEVTCPGVRQALDKLFGGPGELTDTLAVYRGLA